MYYKLRVLWTRIFVRLGIIKQAYHPIDGYKMGESEFADYFDQSSTAIEQMFLDHQGRTIHKWAHYLPIYDRLFGPHRGKKISFLEIGVSRGGSLELWREFFGTDALIAGIDIDEACASRVDPPNRVFIGSQADPSFLLDVIGEIGAPDIILDDGSHIAEHQRVSFATLFPLLKDGGLYVIEDTHTAYWPYGYEGGYRRAGTAIELAKNLVDDMHAWYHSQSYDAGIRDQVLSVSFYDSIIVIEKKKRLPPRHLEVPLSAPHPPTGGDVPTHA